MGLLTKSIFQHSIAARLQSFCPKADKKDFRLSSGAIQRKFFVQLLLCNFYHCLLKTFCAAVFFLYFCSPIKMVVVAQLVRASDCDSEGRGFEPPRLPTKRTKQYFALVLFFYNIIQRSFKACNFSLVISQFKFTQIRFVFTFSF